jgi:DNA-directed RNA polymerase subunit omega
MSMIKPSIEELLPKADNKYILVNMAAKRARHLVSNRQVENEDWIQEKPVSRACREIAEDMITYSTPEDEVLPDIGYDHIELLDDFDETGDDIQPEAEEGAESND